MEPKDLLTAPRGRGALRGGSPRGVEGPRGSPNSARGSRSPVPRGATSQVQGNRRGSPYRSPSSERARKAPASPRVLSPGGAGRGVRNRGSPIVPAAPRAASPIGPKAPTRLNPPASPKVPFQAPPKVPSFTRGATLQTSQPILGRVGAPRMGTGVPSVVTKAAPRLGALGGGQSSPEIRR